MALSKPCATVPDRRIVPVLAASNAGVLHPDAMYEILLRLPARELCRLRVVCRPWRALLSDPHFIAAHSARHPEPLIVAGYSAKYGDHGILCDIMDLSGRVVKRFQATGATGDRQEIVSVQTDLVCIKNGTGMMCRLLNLATGSVCTLPQGFADEHVVDPRYMDTYRALVAFGQVCSTGEYKVLRVLGSLFYCQWLYEVFTIGGSNARWRGKQAPTYRVILSYWNNVVVNGNVYFFTDLMDQYKRDHIALFDLETEEWSPSIRGPLSSLANNAAGLANNHIDWGHLSIAGLGGCLVVAHCTSLALDLWFLMDFQKGLWVKQHSKLT
ncbi:hypothetical protein ACP70R_023384 [Stipagrostis hirtigluma subsp. patula]